MHLTMNLCFGDRAPFGFLEFITGGQSGEHGGVARS